LFFNAITKPQKDQKRKKKLKKPQSTQDYPSFLFVGTWLLANLRGLVEEDVIL